ncbi:MAG: tetratricopeptide repeat protein, partial [Phycisphaerales bacterium]
NRFIESSPGSGLIASASLLCGEALYRTGAHQQAATHLRRVVDEHGDDGACDPALLRLGECLAALQLWPGSEAAFAEYLRRFGDSELWFQAQFGVGWAMENQGRFDEAIAEYRKVIDRHSGPTAARAQFQIGECLYAGRQFEDAARELLKVDILYACPEWSAAALYEAGRCFEELGRPHEAAAQYERLQEEHGKTRWAELAGERLLSLQPAPLPGRADG